MIFISDEESQDGNSKEKNVMFFILMYFLVWTGFKIKSN